MGATVETGIYTGTQYYVGLSANDMLAFIGYGNQAHLTVTVRNNAKGTTQQYDVNLINSAQ